jgi:hypothetical protein
MNDASGNILQRGHWAKLLRSSAALGFGLIGLFAPVGISFAEGEERTTARFASLVQDQDATAVPIVSIRTIGPSSVAHGNKATYGIIARNLSTDQTADISIRVEFQNGEFISAEPTANKTEPGVATFQLRDIPAQEQRSISFDIMPSQIDDVIIITKSRALAETRIATKVLRSTDEPADTQTDALATEKPDATETLETLETTGTPETTEPTHLTETTETAEAPETSETQPEIQADSSLENTTEIDLDAANEAKTETQSKAKSSATFVSPSTSTEEAPGSVLLNSVVRKGDHRHDPKPEIASKPEIVDIVEQNENDHFGDETKSDSQKPNNDVNQVIKSNASSHTVEIVFDNNTGDMIEDGQLLLAVPKGVTLIDASADTVYNSTHERGGLFVWSVKQLARGKSTRIQVALSGTLQQPCDCCFRHIKNGAVHYIVIPWSSNDSDPALPTGVSQCEPSLPVPSADTGFDSCGFGNQLPASPFRGLSGCCRAILIPQCRASIQSCR